jgi:hypothetical protein
MSEDADFLALERLKKYLGSIRLNHEATMNHYVSGDRRGFYHQPQNGGAASRSSTATCVSSLVRAGLWRPEFKQLWDRTNEVAEKLLARPWASAGLKANNPFTLSFIAEGVLDLETAYPDYPNHGDHRMIVEEEIAPKILKYLSRTGGISIHPYPESAYLTQLAFRVVKRLEKVKPDLEKKIHKWAKTEINKQIALLTARSRVADALQLAYALILARTSASDEQVSPEEKQIFDSSLAEFFGVQNEDGSWPYSRPLFHYPNVGNAYCFEFELLTQLLDCVGLRSDLLTYIPKLHQAAQLLQSIRFELNPKKPGTVIGWASGHHPQIEGPESWSTASVYDFAHALDRLVAEAIRRVVFSEIGAIYSPPSPAPEMSPEAFAPGFLDADIHYNNQTFSLRETIAKAFVMPIAKTAHMVARGGQLPTSTPMSGIFFGPPGTSKTQLARMISRFLGWPQLSVDPSYLVQEGLDRIQAMANRLFTMLAMTEQVVVLLDEFDEMGRDRARNREVLSRFITTAMLPKLARINEERKIVFLLATNYVSGFDAAFSRGGRFDMLIQVMPPNLKAKRVKWPILSDVLAKADDDEQRVICEKLQNLTFTETEQLVSKLRQEMTAAQASAQIEAAWKDATLNKPNVIEGEPGQETGEAERAEGYRGNVLGAPKWKDTCVTERTHIRIPGM